MSSKEMNVVKKMTFIDTNKKILKDNILAKIDNGNVAFFILNMLLDNGDINNSEEYAKLLTFVNENKLSTKEEYNNADDILSIIKVFVNKIYSGTTRRDIIIKKLNDCETIFKKYSIQNNKNKVMTI